MSSCAFTTHSSLTELIPKYDGFILDQYGVLHNGVHPLPGALEALKEITNQNKKLVILSNTSSSAKSCLAKLEKLGFDATWFQPAGAVTSGEEASRYIREHYQGKKALWLTYDDGPLTPPPLQFLEKCGTMELATTIDEADFILAHGGEIWKKSVDDHTTTTDVSLGSFMKDSNFDQLASIFKECAARKLPLLCANPDMIVKLADGSTAFMPGTIANYYRDEFGGDVTYFGKPQVTHFKSALEKLGLDSPSARVAHVGDSLHHDIQGANEAGIDSIFVTSGIHIDEFNTEFGEMPSTEKLGKLFEKEGITPTHVVASFEL